MQKVLLNENLCVPLQADISVCEDRRRLGNRNEFHCARLALSLTPKNGNR